MKLTILVILAFLSLGVLSLTAPSKGFDFNFGGKSSLNTRFKETASRFHKSHHNKADEPEPTVEAKKEEATDAKKEESTDAST
jgi:hypothetical protein